MAMRVSDISYFFNEMAPLIDKTGLFRDLLKNAQDKSEIVPDKNRILKRHDKDPLEVKAQIILDHTSQLKEFLSENRDAYIGECILRI